MKEAWKHPLWTQCERLAEAVERAAAALGAASGPLARLPGRCAAFREACRLAVAGQGANRLTIAFVGPRNAGKTTLLRSLISDPEVARQLPVGPDRTGSTRRLDWVGPTPPAALDPDRERWIPCPSERLPSPGFGCELLDVPGFDDRDAAMAETARRALALAAVKILVVDAARLEDAAIVRHLEDADGSCVLPVINQVRSLPEEDVQRFWRTVRAAAPAAEVLEPVLVPDFGVAGAEESEVLAAARREIVSRLESLAEEWSAGSPLGEPLLARRLRVLRERFQREVREIARQALPATAEALQMLERQLREAPRRRLLEAVPAEGNGAEAMVRLRLRALLLARTPHGFVPWRLLLGMAHLIWGVLDRSILLLAGSLPAWWAAAVQAGRTWRDQRRAEAAANLAAQADPPVTQAIRDELAPVLRSVRESLARDLGKNDEPMPTGQTSWGRLSVRGLGTLANQGRALWEETIDRFAPGRLSAWVAGMIGLALFWSVALGPLVSVYVAHFDALRALVGGGAGTPPAFPRDLGSLMGTAFVLGLLPMALWLVVSVSWMTRRSRVRRLLLAFRSGLERQVDHAIDSGLLCVDATDPELAACRLLLAGGEGAAERAAAAPRTEISSNAGSSA